MKKGEKQTPEGLAAIAKGRAAYWDRKRAEKAAQTATPNDHVAVASKAVAEVDSGTVAIGPTSSAPIVVANGHASVLDIADPEKWQMKIRMFLEACEPDAADMWLSKFRLIFQMSGAVVRDQRNRHLAARCFCCRKPFKDGRPACEAGYYDADRNYIKIYGCDQSEFGDLLKAVREKEDSIARAEEKAEKAARQALIDSRSASRKELRA